jgi:Flp pilus assembly protein TadG
MVRPGLDVVGVRGVRTPATGRGERGAVTAETAMVLPLLVAAALGLVWMLALAVTQVRVTDAAREVARALAREEPKAAAVALGRRVAPDGARFDVRDDGSLVAVDVTAEVSGVPGLFGFLPGITVDATAVAAQEPR